MRRELFDCEISVDCFIEMREGIDSCPVCNGPLEYNVRTGEYGQWAHFICNTKPHLKRYGKAVIGSKLNGRKVCSLDCNNAVQLNYKSQPILCDELADYICEKEGLHGRGYE